ncbi:MAG: phosphoribosylamine--glycine ligase [Armatimonadota bacterium]
MRQNNLNVLVIGSGGREHALVWKIAKSPRVDKVFCAPGNAGTAAIGENLPIKPTEFDRLIEVSKEKKIDLVVVGPETPLIAGIVDAFSATGIPVFGPTRLGAQLEGSKVFTKELLLENNIPTGGFAAFDDPEKAIADVKKHFAGESKPIVIKADGEAAGKGVIIANTEAEALDAVDMIMVKKAFGASGNKIIIEEFLEGQEASIMAFVSGGAVQGMLPAQDYKRAQDSDKGPNTGGMGCYSCVPAVTPEIYDTVIEKIIRPTIKGLAAKGIDYCGVLYAGVILTADGPKLLEYNCRLGDPETEVVLPLLETDLVDIIEAAIEHRLDGIEIKWYNKKAVCVVLASKGYPGSYDTGFPISGIANAESIGAIVFHAGTKLVDGRVVTSGGRVLGVTATGGTFRDAVAAAYEAVEKISFEGMTYRKDIGARVL